MEKINLLVENNDNYRLDKIIALNMEELSRTQIQEMIGQGLVLVNGKEMCIRDSNWTQRTIYS